MHRLSPRLRRNFTYANVVSIIVILIATSGTAYGAIRLYTGKLHIKDGTLTGIDFRNLNLQARDIALTSISSMRGRKGPVGDTGAPGAAGAQGLTGDRGDMGKQAHSLVRYATYYSPYLRDAGTDVPNPGAKDWDASDYPTYPGASATYPNFTTTVPSPVAITNNEPVLVQLTGNNHVTTGTIRPTGAGLLTATATLTVMHQNNGESGFGTVAGNPLHSRIRCKLRYANNGAAITAGSSVLGAGEWLSSRESHRVFTITLTGSEPIPANLLANYNVGVSCADIDRTNANQWMFVAGTVTAHAVYVQ